MRGDRHGVAALSPGYLRRATDTASPPRNSGEREREGLHVTIASLSPGYLRRARQSGVLMKRSDVVLQESDRWYSHIHGGFGACSKTCRNPRPRTHSRTKMRYKTFGVSSGLSPNPPRLGTRVRKEKGKG